MKVIALALIVMGIIWLILSLNPTKKMLVKTQGVGWRFLYLLIASFILIYSASFIYILGAREFIIAFFAQGLLLAGGGAFVYVVTRYSYNSILELEYQASHDRITKLKNRHSFIESVESLTRISTPFYVMLIDLNGFKKFNDAFGHPFGDELLKNVALNLSQTLPRNCNLFRVGGDEFAILGKEGDSQQIENDIKIIQDIFRVPLTVFKQNLSVGISIGVSIYPSHSHNPLELVQQAEQALYSSKKSKGNRQFFSQELNKNAREQLEISNQIRHAMDSNEFTIHYQPIIEASNNSTHGAEVLIRWQKEDGLFVAPDKFIPIAEQSTLIHDITCWVLKQVVEDLPVLDSNGFTGCLHINLSAKDLHNNLLLECIQEAVNGKKLDPKRIVFEVTESVMVTDIRHAAQIIARLSALGFRFSIDDFGTGYSSFSLLRDLPLAQIKIDRSYVMNMHNNDSNRSIVNSMLFLAKSLDCSAVAEGVEESETRQLLKEMDCDYLQGYLYSKPVSLDEFIHFCKRIHTEVS